MATIQTNIRWADNTEQLRKNLQQGIDTLDVMRKQVDRTVQSLGGTGLLQAANRTAAAILELGGVTKLTASEQERASAILDKAIDKYDALGKTAPTAIRELAAALKEGTESTGGWLGILSELGNSFVARVAEGVLLRDAVRKVIEIVGEAAMAVPDLVEKTIKLGSELLTTSEKTGISVESLSKLRYVAAQTGTDLPTLTGAIQKMQAQLGAVGDESQKTRDALAKLGLSLSGLKNASADEAFLTILDRLHQLPTAADRAGVGMALFGKGFREISQLAAVDVRGLIKEAEDLGIVMTTDTAAAAKAAEDALARFKAQAESVALRLGAAFLPAVIGIAHDLSDLLKLAIDGTNDSLSKMGGATGFLANVSAAMGAGNGAIAAQTALYFQLRDAVIGLIRNGLEPVITAIGFTGKEFNAAKVVFGDIEQVILGDALAFEYLALAVAKAGNITTFGKAFAADLPRIQGNIDSLLIRMSALGASLQQAKANEESWTQASTTANAAIEAALNKVAASHVDVAAIIKQVGDVSRAAAQNAGVATGDMSAAAEALEKSLNKLLEQITPLPGHFVLLKDQVAAFGAEADKLTREADVMGLKVPKAIREIADAWNQQELTKVAQQLTDKWSKDLDKFISDAQKKFEKTSEAVNKAFADAVVTEGTYITKLSDLTATDAEKVSQEWAAAIAKLGQPPPGLEATWKRSLDAINAFFETQYANWTTLRTKSTSYLQDIANKEYTTYLAMQADSANFSAAAIENQRQVAKAAQDAADGVTHAWTKAFTSIAEAIPGLLQQAFTGGGGLAGFAKASGSLVGQKLGEGIVDHLKEVDPDLMGKAIGKFFASAIPVIGSLAGPLIEKFISLFDHVPDDLRRDAYQYGVQIGDDVMKGIRQDMDQLHLSEQAATIFNAAKLFPTVDASNFAAALKITRDAFVELGRHELTAAQTNQVLTDMWPRLAAAGTSALGVLNAKLVELIKLDRDYQTHNQQIADYLKGQATSGTQDFADALGVTSAAYKQLADDAEKAKTAQGADLDSLNADMKAQQAIIEATSVHTQDAASAMGAALAGEFDGLIASGSSFADAIKAIGPGVSSLGTILQKTGFDGGAAFTALQAEVGLYNDSVAGPALTYTNALAKGIVTLGNMGKLDEATFRGLGSQITSTFNSLVAQGKDGGGVLVGLQDPLQTLWEEEQQFGFKADDSTQALIDEAVAAGEVGEKHKSASDQMIDALSHIDADIQMLVKAFGVDLPGAIGDTAKAFDKIPKKVDVDVNTNYTSTGTPYERGPGVDTSGSGETGPEITRAATGGLLTALGIQRFVFGGIVQQPRVPLTGFGTDTALAAFTPGEMIFNAIQQQSLANLLAAGASMANDLVQIGRVGASTPTPPAVFQFGDLHVYPAPGTDLKNMDQFAPAFLEGLRRDTGGMRTGIESIAKRVSG